MPTYHGMELSLVKGNTKLKTQADVQRAFDSLIGPNAKPRPQAGLLTVYILAC